MASTPWRVDRFGPWRSWWWRQTLDSAERRAELILAIGHVRDRPGGAAGAELATKVRDHLLAKGRTIARRARLLPMLDARPHEEDDDPDQGPDARDPEQWPDERPNPHEQLERLDHARAWRTLDARLRQDPLLRQLADVMQETGAGITEACARAGLSRATVYRRMKRLRGRLSGE
jgi:hypothetical protein